MKKVLVIFVMLALALVFVGLESDAAKKSKKGGISEEEMTAMTTTIDSLTKKMYARGLFSPEDNSNLIDIKIKLDNQMLVSPDVALAPFYYKAGILYKSRDMKDDAIDCFQTILENFGETALAPKAMAQLKLMGVAVTTIPKAPTDGAEGAE